MRFLCACWALLVAWAAMAAELPARPSAKLLLAEAASFADGRCVRYEEGGGGRIMVDPTFYLEGEIVGVRVVSQHLGVCPVAPGKADLLHYSRAEFVRHLHALPCVSAPAYERDERLGMVRVRVMRWETPYERRMENQGRLYRGHFVDQPLQVGSEIEVEADLLGVCPGRP